ncbi:18709_t:CDS:2, partial [Gigaspora rosea]
LKILEIDYLKQQVEELIVQYKIKEFDFSKHENRKKIASGGFSFVYSIVFEGNLYALKCINNNMGCNAFKLLKREIKLLHNVNHPSVIKFYGISRAQIENAEEITQRPTLDIILDELTKLQANKIEFITNIINEQWINKQWIKRYFLNRGGNIKGSNFVIGRTIVLGDNGVLKIDKIRQSIPIIYFPKRKNRIETEYNNVYIHIPVLTLHYECDATSEFIQDIREALNISDTTVKIKMLEEKFNSYGEYVAASMTIGGVITIKNWSEIDNACKSRLKAYLQLSIDHAKGLRLKNFENMPIDDLNMFVNSKSIQTAGDLYNWVRDLHNDNSKCLEIISYEKFKPTFKLLPEDLIQKIFEYSKVQYLDESELISKIRSQYDMTKGLEWITSSELPLCICDWVQDNLLQHGIILLRSKLGRAKKAALKFLKEPKITPINKITIILTQPKTHQETYLLENGIILKKEDRLELDKIPFTEHSSMFNIPFEDFTNSKRLSSNAIYCQIIFHTMKLSFDMSDVEYSQEFLNAVTSAHQDSESSKNLYKLFGNDYGQLLPRTFTLGG